MVRTPCRLLSFLSHRPTILLRDLSTPQPSHPMFLGDYIKHMSPSLPLPIMFNPTPILSLSQPRITQLETTIHKFVTSFSEPLDTAITKAKFLEIYHEDIEWFDHAFMMRRIGHDAVLGLHRSFNYCNQPFKAEIKVSFLPVLALTGG